MRIDAHVHFWGPAELERYEWMGPEMDAIRRPFEPDDLVRPPRSARRGSRRTRHYKRRVPAVLALLGR